MPGEYHFLPVNYLQPKFGQMPEEEEEAVFIAGNLLPDPTIVKCLGALENNTHISYKNNVLVLRSTLKHLRDKDISSVCKEIHLPDDYCPFLLEYTFDIFLKNGEEICKDFDLVTAGRKSQPVPDCVRTLCSGRNDSAHPIFIEEGAVVECATINTTEGPVYIGKNASLMEGACIRGPFALCEEAEVRMGAKIYEATTIGPHCKAGGEISNTIFFGYSNKSHDGYLGNAVIGEWCNIGAGTNASNLKNDYSLIRVWNYAKATFMRTDLQFCGLIMGDHSKIGVNCMINTATVIGVGVNIHGAGFPRQFVPCFSEGSPAAGFTQVPLKKFLDTATRVMSRRDLPLTPTDIEILSHIYHL